MGAKWQRTPWAAAAALAWTLAAPGAGRAADPLEVPVTLAPHRVVLNAVGQSETVQAVLGLAGAAGPYQVSADPAEFDLRLAVDGVEVAEAVALYYCVLDDNLLVFFDRGALLPALADWANLGPVEAAVFGWFTELGPGGEPIVWDVEGYDDLEVVAPGKAGRPLGARR